MALELDKTYEPRSVEERWAKFWLERGYFHADSSSSSPPFSMVIPPPNITGSLHLGHALNSTLQDILARWKRMQGFNTLWVPGTDHAGIATQNVVERQLAEEGIERQALGREEFTKRIWRWKERSGGRILNQLKGLGASCDWERERFTLDPGLNRAVREVFVRLYQEGLSYRAKRLINWCPRCQTALSDVEVEHEEVLGKLYYIDYPLADTLGEAIRVATTRPETMLGDTAVAVHPADARYERAVGKAVLLPLGAVAIPIIADTAVDPSFGTGAVKVTPAHDFNDEMIAKRHGLPFEVILNPDGTLAPTPRTQQYAGLTVEAARSAVVKDLDQLRRLAKIEDHPMSIGRCYRCKTVVEPFLSTQWFIRVNDPRNSLAKAAIDAVRERRIRLIPEGWENNYFGWMENIQDWCVSRQIWWGHQIPSWYCLSCNREKIYRSGDQWLIGPGADPIVQTDPPTGCASCGSQELIQDPDVLDTWFSSALWPFSTLGWPPQLEPDPEKRREAEALIRKFYPTSTLVSAFDILFFWIARMIMMGLYFMKEVPFREVYIHALVRDAEGQKMSKSKGNVIDPLQLMERYGTDALRFTLAAMSSPGRDIKLSEERIGGYRNFANKIWNAGRFALMNLSEGLSPEPQTCTHPPSLSDRWIRSRLSATVVAVNRYLEQYRFDEAAGALYRFIWHEFCDWYLEMIKVDLQGAPQEQAKGTTSTLAATFEELLRLLHPFMPFLSEELWAHFPHRGESLCIAPYPGADPAAVDETAEQVVREMIIEPVIGIRNLRGEMGIPPSEQIALLIRPNSDREKTLFEEHLAYLSKLGRVAVEEIGLQLRRPKASARILCASAEMFVPLGEARIQRESERLEKVLTRLERELEPMESKLADPRFLSKAPKEIVEKLELQRAEKTQEREKLTADLRRFEEMIS